MKTISRFGVGVVSAWIRNRELWLVRDWWILRGGQVLQTPQIKTSKCMRLSVETNSLLS